MAGFLQPVSPNASTLDNVSGSALYPTSPTLTSAQAEANPLSSGIQTTQNSGGILDSVNNWLGNSIGMGGPAISNNPSSPGNQNSVIPTTTSATNILSTIQNLLSGVSLERGLIILIGVIMLGIGLWMLKGPSVIAIPGITRAS